MVVVVVGGYPSEPNQGDQEGRGRPPRRPWYGMGGPVGTGSEEGRLALVGSKTKGLTWIQQDQIRLGERSLMEIRGMADSGEKRFGQSRPMGQSRFAYSQGGQYYTKHIEDPPDAEKKTQCSMFQSVWYNAATMVHFGV